MTGGAPPTNDIQFGKEVNVAIEANDPDVAT